MARILYKIENKINGKIYIGQTKVKRYKERMAAHCRKNGIDSLINRAIKKYGKESFVFDILVIVEDHMINETEIKAIKVFNSLAPHGYNLNGGGQGCLEPSPETREKFKKAKIGKKQTKEHVEARRKGMIGHIVSEETKRKIAESNKRKDYSGRATPESKLKQSITLKRKYASGEMKKKKKRSKGSNNKTGYLGVWLDKKRNKFIAEIICNGKKYYIGQFDTAEQAAYRYNEKAKELHKELAFLNDIPGNIEEIARLSMIKHPRPRPSTETIEKRRKMLLGQKRTPEQKTKYSEAFKGRIISEQQRKDISNTLKGNIPWNKGKKMSNEYCEIMKKAKQKYHKNKGDINEKTAIYNNGIMPSRFTLPRLFSNSH